MVIRKLNERVFIEGKIPKIILKVSQSSPHVSRKLFLFAIYYNISPWKT